MLGRLNFGEKFPFKEKIFAACFTVAKLADGEKELAKFDASRNKLLSAVKEYRDNTGELELENGTYVIIPSCLKGGCLGKFFLSIYHECKDKYIEIYNARTGKKGLEIAEESETQKEYDKKFKKVLKTL